MWSVIDRSVLVKQINTDHPAQPYSTYWEHAGSILKAVYRWTKEKRNTTRKGSADWKRYTTLMDKLQQEIKRG